MAREVIVYTTNYCPYCNMAKQLLAKLDLKFKEVKLDDKDELRTRLSEENGGWRTVPMIFIGDQFIGGYDDLSALHRSGELIKKVQSE